MNKQSILRSLTLLLMCFGLAACGNKASDGPPPPNSQTHWLKQCDSKSDCGGLSCVCGHCVEVCPSDNECSGSRECRSAESDAVSAMCEAEPAKDLCLQECKKDSECDDPAQCVDGACVVPQPSSKDCAGLTQEDCQEDPSCKALVGEVVATGVTLFECIDLEECTTDRELTLCATSPEGELVLFPTQCAPSAFSEVDLVECTPGDCTSVCDVAGCNAEQAGECTARGCAPLTAQSSDGANVVAGCVPANPSCDGALTCGAPAGDQAEALLFPDSCIPLGWSAVDSAACEADTCTDNSESECDADANCQSYRGSDVGGAEPRFITCDVRTGDLCGDAERCAALGESAAINFSSTCLPPGYEELPMEQCQPTVTACATRPLDACEGEGCMPIGGYNSDEEYIVVACGDSDGPTCPPVTTCARPADSPNAEGLEFGGCIPAGWVECDAPPMDGCATLEPQECEAAPACSPLTGVNSGGESVVVGCAASDRICDSAQHCVAPPELVEQPLMFSNGCYPDGWVELDYAACGEEGAECSDIQEEAGCRGACFPLQGRSVAEPDLSFYGCRSDTGCGDAETCASALESDPPVLFYDTCIPAEWTRRPIADCDGI